jgi:hypothetical protein
MANLNPPRRNKFNSVIVDEVHSNVSQEIIEITADKLTIILTKHIQCLEKSKEWQLPLSLVLTILLVFTTTNFKDSLGVPSATWSAVFMIACGLSVIWLIKTLWQKSQAMTIDDILKSVKNQT